MSRHGSFSPSSSLGRSQTSPTVLHDLSIETSLQEDGTTTTKVHTVHMHAQQQHQVSSVVLLAATPFNSNQHTYDPLAPSIADAVEFRAAKRARLIHVTLISLGLMAAWIFNNVSFVYLSDRAGQTYAFFLDQMTTFILVLMQVPIFLYQLYIAKTIPWEDLTVLPWKVLLIMGTADAVYDCFVTVGSPYTPGPIQTILFQLPIPITMVLSFIIYHKRFRNGQYLGGLIILGGAVMTVAPALLRVMQGKSSQAGSNEGAQIKPASVGFYALGVVFFSCNTLYKESKLQKTKINIWYLSIVDSSLNFLITFLLIPLLWLPGLGNDTPSSTFPHFWGGIKCFFLQRTDVDPNAICEGLWWLAIVNVASNVIVNILSLMLIRQGSAVLMQVVSGIQLPICNLFYACQFIMTTAYVTKMDQYMWWGLALVVVGFAIYSWLPLGPTNIDPLGDHLDGEINIHDSLASKSIGRSIRTSTGGKFTDASLHSPLIHSSQHRPMSEYEEAYLVETSG